MTLSVNIKKSTELVDCERLVLLAGLSGGFAGSPIPPSRLKRAFTHTTPES
jgi:hypothetical protein